MVVTQADAQGTLRIGMTASDIPVTTGQTDQGGEGMRFLGYTVYDAPINWDLSNSDKASDLAPGLATEWSVDPADRSKWTFKLRHGVKFHDESDPDAAADLIRRPAHHYHRGLLASTVHGAMRGARLDAIPGAPPDLSAPPVGCAFAPRCRFAEAPSAAGRLRRSGT